MNNDLISRSEAEKLGATCLAKRNENGQLEAIISLDNAPIVDLWQMRQDATENALKKAEVLYGRQQGEWISVSERLPERYKEVIVTDIEVSNTYQSRYIGNGYWECDNGTFKNRIIAWQPLPEPYKKGAEE